MKSRKITGKLVRSLIKKREHGSNKGDYGHVLIIAGSRGMSGAPALCASGALRSGAGLVTVAVPECIEGIAAKNLKPEAMMLAAPSTKEGTFSFKALKIIESYIKKRKVTCLVLGPGLRVNKDTEKLVRKLLLDTALPVVLDADGLNAVSKDTKVLSIEKARLVLTPHPGEMARLMAIKTASVQADRQKTVLEAVKQFKAVCVLKGSGTVISDSRSLYKNTTGNPGMAKGGSGDVLAGVIGALVSQVKPPVLLNAALAGVFIHGLAGDLAAKKNTQISMTAGDITENLRAAFRKVING